MFIIQVLASHSFISFLPCLSYPHSFLQARNKKSRHSQRKEPINRRRPDPLIAPHLDPSRTLRHFPWSVDDRWYRRHFALGRFRWFYLRLWLWGVVGLADDWRSVNRQISRTTDARVLVAPAVWAIVDLAKQSRRGLVWLEGIAVIRCGYRHLFQLGIAGSRGERLVEFQGSPTTIAWIASSFVSTPIATLDIRR